MHPHQNAICTDAPPYHDIFAFATVVDESLDVPLSLGLRTQCLFFPKTS